MSVPTTTTQGLTSDSHSETERCLLHNFRASFWLSLLLACWLCSTLVRSGLASARNKPVVGRYLFRSVFPLTLILLCPLGATQCRAAMCAGSLPLDLQKMAALCDVMKCCRGFPLFFLKIKNAYACVRPTVRLCVCVRPTVRLCVCVRPTVRLCVCVRPTVRLCVYVCVPLSDYACVCPTVRLCVCVRPTVRLCVCVRPTVRLCVPHCQIVCAPLSDCVCVCAPLSDCVCVCVPHCQIVCVRASHCQI